MVLDNTTIDFTINEIDQIRLRLIVKYGTTFSNLSIPDQVKVIELVLKVVLGK